MHQPDLKSKVISIICIIVFICMIILAAYLPSALSGDVNADIFSISQSLAFGNKPAIISLLTLALVLLIFLIHYRGHKQYLIIRIFLLLIIYTFIITIIWVSTYYNETDHYILASIIFISIFIYICITSIVIFNSLKSNGSVSTMDKTIVFGIPVLGVLGFIGLGLSNIDFIKQKLSYLFPSFENYIVLMQVLSILMLGFK